MPLIILRWHFPEMSRPVKVPLYPLLPVLFFGLCLYMLYSSVTVVGCGAFLGFRGCWWVWCFWLN
ncbi:hypothetical protein EDF87_12174 [Pseudomonas helmanticensis]|uniref:Uncharacterized protein n=2 Tax=Pseudomonas TaxID=286 RepID=A0A4R7UV67_9PSED|nr:hypothetical protein EDF87_12174 [Pseudomonas helmanticensis]VVP92275.1 hypothetical protein PS941_01802 [Pseudomonas fluorescens]